MPQSHSGFRRWAKVFSASIMKGGCDSPKRNLWTMHYNTLMIDVKIRLRFYLPHDMDLISLMITHEMDIVHAMYCSVKSFVKKESFAIKIPPLRNIPMEKKRVFHRNLSLDSEKDQDIIELLECIEPGYRNNFLKNILRLYLFCPGTEAFLRNPDDMLKLESYYEVFRKDKRVADAAAIHPKRKRTYFEKKIVPAMSAKEETSTESQLVATGSIARPSTEQAEMVDAKSKKVTVDDIKMEDETTDSISETIDDDLTALFTGLLG